MHEPSPVCRAFLALSDEPGLDAPPPRAGAAVRLCSLLAAAVLAIAAPVGWASAAPDQPLATATKMQGAVDGSEDDGGDDDDVSPDEPVAQAKTATGGEPWAAATT